MVSHELWPWSEKLSHRSFQVLKFAFDKISLAVIALISGWWLSRRLERFRSEEAWSIERAKKQMELADRSLLAISSLQQNALLMKLGAGSSGRSPKPQNEMIRDSQTASGVFLAASTFFDDEVGAQLLKTTKRIDELMDIWPKPAGEEKDAAWDLAVSEFAEELSTLIAFLRSALRHPPREERPSLLSRIDRFLSLHWDHRGI